MSSSAVVPAMKLKSCSYIIWGVFSLVIAGQAPDIHHPSTSKKGNPQLPPISGMRSLSIPFQQNSAHQADVSVTCSATQLVVRVKKTFYGLTTTAEELMLGESCKSNAVDKTSGDLLFTYPLSDCDGKRETVSGYLVYKFDLHYEPRASRLAVRRAHRFHVDIECHLKSYHHVYQLAVQPTWETPSSKILRGQSAGYRILLMNDAWTAPSSTNAFFLGQMVNFQVTALKLPTGRKLFIDHCYATMSEVPQAKTKYIVIENFGCMVDSKMDGSSTRFIAPRTDDAINFSISSFQFAPKPSAQIFLHCKLFVTSGDPGSTAKSCTYSKGEKRWKALSGEDSICDCCDSKCLTPKARRSHSEGFQSSGPLVFKQVPKALSTDPAPVLWFDAQTDNYEDPAWLENFMYGEDYFEKEGSKFLLVDEDLQLREEKAVLVNDKGEEPVLTEKEDSSSRQEEDWGFKYGSTSPNVDFRRRE